MVLEKLDGRPLKKVLTSIQQGLTVVMRSSTDANAHTTEVHGLNAHHFQMEELEDLSIRFLSAYSGATNWTQIISLRNKSHQTMAHMSVMLGYLQLLRSLIGWGIDINLTDLQGSTALHYAFLCAQSACAVLLIHSGADELALDELGRSPWDLNPSLVDEVTSQLRGVPKVDGSFSVSCSPVEEEWETEYPGEAAALKAKYLLVQRWLQRKEEEQHNIDDLSGEHMAQSGTSPACLPSNLCYENGAKLGTLLAPEPFVTASPAPVYRSPSPPSDGAPEVPPFPGETFEPPPTNIAEPEQVVRPLSPVPVVLQPRQPLLDDIWRDAAVVVRPESSSGSGMRPQMQPKHLTERLEVEIPKQDVEMITSASSSPLSSPPDEYDEQGSPEVESDEESSEEGYYDEDESMTESNAEESSEGPPILIRRGERTTVEFSDSSSPPSISLAGTHTVRNAALELPKGGGVPVDDDHSSPSPLPQPKPSAIRTAASIVPTSEHDNLMELDEQPQARIPPTPQTLESSRPPANTEPASTSSAKTAEEAPAVAPRQPSPKAPPIRRISYLEYKNRKREQGLQLKVVPLPEATSGSIAPLLGLAASPPVQIPTTAASPFIGRYSSALSTSTPSAISGLGPFMGGSSTTSIGEPIPVLPPKRDLLTSPPRPSAAPPPLVGASATMPAPSSTPSLVNPGSNNQTSTDPRLRPLSPVNLPTVPTKSNGHPPMTTTAIPIVSPVLPAPTVPFIRSNTTPVLRST